MSTCVDVLHDAACCV